jgi:3-oxoacyl-[acyl-carrier protein] reductase
VNFLDLTNRVAIVTGAAQGIGLAIAKRFVMAHASVAIVDVNLRGAQDVANDLHKTEAPVSAFASDVSDPNSVRNMVDAVLKTFHQIDILVNNAGIVGRIAPIQDQTDDDWHRLLAIDLTGVFYCCRAVIPHMIKRGTGRIINIASIAGKEGNLNMVPYSAAKAGVIGLTKALAKEVVHHNIFVNAVTPALIQTSVMDEGPAESIKNIAKLIPMGRAGRPEEVAALAHWLASDDASFSTGAIFDISGGRATY